MLLIFWLIIFDFTVIFTLPRIYKKTFICLKWWSQSFVDVVAIKTHDNKHVEEFSCNHYLDCLIHPECLAMLVYTSFGKSSVLHADEPNHHCKRLWGFNRTIKKKRKKLL